MPKLPTSVNNTQLSKDQGKQVERIPQYILDIEKQLRTIYRKGERNHHKFLQIYGKDFAKVWKKFKWILIAVLGVGGVLVALNVISLKKKKTTKRKRKPKR